MPSGVNTPNQESGALLYIILAKASAAGGGAMASAADDLTTAQKIYVSFSGTQKETYADGFQQSIGFNRWENRAEVQATPYIDPKATFLDPLDPQNFCNGWATFNPSSTIKQTEVQTLLQFIGQNRVVNVYSYGLNGVPDVVPDNASNDDILGYRTLQPGNKGFHP